LATVICLSCEHLPFFPYVSTHWNKNIYFFKKALQNTHGAENRQGIKQKKNITLLFEHLRHNE